MLDELQKSYDEFSYRSLPFQKSHPDRLATIGTLFGMSPAPVDRCRVLEVGCASGGNLIPMAASLPNSEFVGIDLSPVQIGRGVADIAALGLSNIRLLAMDIMEFSEAFGTFDYIVAHGVYSWVPNAVQERLLAICARHLAPAGIAYVSYNTLPGWSMRTVVREAMIYHTRGIADPAQRVAQARALLEFLADSVKDVDSAYAIALRTQAKQLRTHQDYYIAHEHLEVVNEPLYFHQFIDRAARQGLAYLGEAQFAQMLGIGFSPKVKETLARIAPDVLRREQYIDFRQERAFREMLLVHDGIRLIRKISPLRVMSLRVASEARPVRGAPDLEAGAVEEFRTPQDAWMRTSSPIIKAAMVELAGRWPAATTFDDLCAAARSRVVPAGLPTEEERGRLASDLLKFYAADVVELHHPPSPFVVDVGGRPEASALARLQAARGASVTSLRHENHTIAADRIPLLLLLDGTRTRREIAGILWPGTPENQALQELDAALAHLARHALMVR
jgi:cyclopropane fatty-acyl-phospholipid synthase-like methyltransferase/methyltransferase-like protein